MIFRIGNIVVSILTGSAPDILKPGDLRGYTSMPRRNKALELTGKRQRFFQQLTASV
jgi:hypothetical protein